jgi:hypothetical protein
VFADLVEDLWTLRSRDRRSGPTTCKVLVATGSYMSRYYWHLPVYGMKQAYISPTAKDLTQTIRKHLPVAVIGDPAVIHSMAALVPQVTFEELRSFPRVGESLYLARRKRKGPL